MWAHVIMKKVSSLEGLRHVDRSLAAYIALNSFPQAGSLPEVLGLLVHAVVPIDEGLRAIVLSSVGYSCRKSATK